MAPGSKHGPAVAALLHGNVDDTSGGIRSSRNLYGAEPIHDSYERPVLNPNYANHVVMILTRPIQ